MRQKFEHEYYWNGRVFLVDEKIKYSEWVVKYVRRDYYLVNILVFEKEYTDELLIIE